MRPRDKKEPMAQTGWYHDRAAECDRMARASRSPVARSRHEHDRDRWREIAASIDAADEAVKLKNKSRPPGWHGVVVQPPVGL